MSDVYYQEVNDISGMCVEGVDGTVKWSPIKISRSSVRLSSSSEGEDIDIDRCLSLDFQVKDGVPGFDIETADSSFWVPIAKRTRSQMKQ